MESPRSYINRLFRLSVLVGFPTVEFGNRNLSLVDLHLNRIFSCYQKPHHYISLTRRNAITENNDLESSDTLGTMTKNKKGRILLIPLARYLLSSCWVRKILANTWSLRCSGNFLADRASVFSSTTSSPTSSTARSDLVFSPLSPHTSSARALRDNDLLRVIPLRRPNKNIWIGLRVVDPANSGNTSSLAGMSWICVFFLFDTNAATTLRTLPLCRCYRGCRKADTNQMKPLPMTGLLSY